MIPTREARHQRLYVFRDGCDRPDALRAGSFYRFHYCLDDAHARSPKPVDESCDCLLCARYSRAYLHHLWKVGDPQAQRLATAHNLRFYQRLMALIRDGD